MNVSRHEIVLSGVKKQKNDMALDFTAIEVSTMFLREYLLSVRVRLIRQVTSARESLRTKSDNFPHRNFDLIFHRVRAFTGVSCWRCFSFGLSSYLLDSYSPGRRNLKYRKAVEMEKAAVRSEISFL